MVTLGPLDYVKIVLYTLEWISGILVFSITADQLKIPADRLKIPFQSFGGFGGQTLCVLASSPNSSGVGICNAVISLAVIAWLFLTIIIILYVLWLFNVGPRIPPLVETICFIIIALLWLIIGILFSAQVREGNSDLSYLKTVQALSWIAFVLSVASAVVAFFAKGS